MKYIFIALFFTSCLYKAGNRERLMGFLIKSDIKPCKVRKNLDSILIVKNLMLPDSMKAWIFYPSDAKYFPNDNKVLYFKENPEEFYLLSIDSDIRLNGVFNKNLSEDGWIYDESKLPLNEIRRIESRIETNVIYPLGKIHDANCN